jgi:hypothetical protein
MNGLPFVQQWEILMRLRILTFAALCALLIMAHPVAAQPFGGTFSLSSTDPGYIAIPNSVDLNPTSTITLEAWVSVGDTAGGCKSLIGKDYVNAYWVGICGRTLRSYLRGSASLFDGGTIPLSQLTHIAVTFDGATRRHYINGELIASRAETGALTTTTRELRIGSDVNYNVVPSASFSEVRLWSVARTQAQIRSTINVQLTTPQTGLVAAWGFGANDNLHNHDGSIVGHFTALDLPIAPNCGSTTSTFLCLDNRFSISALFRTGAPGTAETQAHTVASTSPSSGLFWFSTANTWQVLVNALDNSAVNNYFWINSAATTNLFYRMTVYDIQAGVQKIYFNYPGSPAPAVLDSYAFATCP